MKRVFLLALLSTTLIAATAASKISAHREASDEELLVRTATQLVTLPVTVRDSAGRIVSGLARENFTVYDNGVKQRIELFSQQDRPMTIGLIIDTSISMKGRLDGNRAAVREFLNASLPQDQFFLISFNTSVRLERDFTGSAESIISSLNLLAADGLTALNDAIYLGLAKAARGRYQKRALLLLTDGDNNNSKYKDEELLYAAAESDVQIYIIALSDKRSLSKAGRKLIIDYAEISGGSTFFPQNRAELIAAIETISAELHNQYAIGFAPSAPPAGKQHTLKIVVKGDDNNVLAARTRKSYFY